MRFVILAGLWVILSGCGGGAIERLNPAPASEAQYRLGGCQLRGHGVCKDMEEFAGTNAQAGNPPN
ncbi:hypothetical protein [Phyllobacterium lublinensis]|uniref:hypothetical protein n=1 Tax=Phyllobacterium lublinensis TaxID=2875708 RepID=UPI001CCBBD21|nr:hypothetical protein [Phyllobacterium sp. 2063]MBZ9653888.1 hypothetical protein [Phyllobacterium sp. 2063]